jgi:hypothetical protein
MWLLLLSFIPMLHTMNAHALAGVIVEFILTLLIFLKLGHIVRNPLF